MINLFKKKKEPEQAPQVRSMNSWDYLAGKYSGFGVKGVENISTVFACIDVISSALASLDIKLYRMTDDGKLPVKKHPVLTMFKRPNERLSTTPDLLHWFFGQCLLHGNSVIWIDGNKLVPIPWQNVHVRVSDSGKLSYVIRADYANAPSRTVAASRIIHMKDRSDDGIIGRSRISRAPDVIRYCQALQDASIALWSNNAAPSAALQLQGKLTPEQRQQFTKDVRENYQSAKNRGGVLVLDQGTAWLSLSTDPKDAETLSTRQWATTEICRLFEVSPVMVQQYEFNRFQVSREATKWLKELTLASWAKKFSAVVSNALLEDDHVLELDLSMYGRTSLKERWDSYAIAIDKGVLTAEEVRELEGYGKMPSKEMTNDRDT